MKRLISVVAAAAVGMAGFAHAADLPTAKPAAESAKPNCFASFWTWLNSSASDCPLTYAGITFYGTLDLDATYLHNGVNPNPSADKDSYGIQRNAYESKGLFSYNGLSTTVVGLKMKEEVLPYGWSLIGVLEAGVNPYSGMFYNGPRTLADNNVRPAGNYPWQNRNSDSSRAGQWDNSQAFLGVSNPVYGTLTFGRTNSLSNDVTSAYDPVASSAFSLIGFSSSFAGFGNTETVRANTAFTYRLTYQNFRAAAQVQVGGYGVGNATNGMYQGQLGADFGALSVDGVLSWAKDAVSLSTFGGSNVACLTPANCFINVNNTYYNPNEILKATLSNNLGGELGAKYKWDPFTFYGGWIYARLMNPSDDYLTGFPTISQGIFIPPGFFKNGVYTNSAITVNAYNVQRVLNTFWTGIKWKVLSNLEAAVGFYYQGQNNYNTSPCTGSGPFISSSKCSGSQDGLSIFLDWKPFKRVDVYGGVMVTNVYGGIANGYFSTSNVVIPGTTTVVSVNTARTQNYDPTAGIRVRF
jgi:predicted porin